MTGTVRMIHGTRPLTVINGGRRYTAAVGSVSDVHESDVDALASAGWTKVAPSGPTAARPAAPAMKQQFFDTTLNKLIVADASGTWRDPATGAAV